MQISEKIEQMTSKLLALRSLQEKTEADFLLSLGGLSIAQLNLLNVIGDLKSSTMGEIANRSALSLSSVTLMTDKLVRMQLVSRVRSQTDRRIVRASLTMAGEKIYQAQIKHLYFVSQKMLNALDEEEQDIFLHILNKITTHK